MGMADTLTPADVRNRLPPQWDLTDGEIVRTYDFESYLAGVEFATDVARVADELDHHPRMVIEFRTVTVAVHSHDAGGITERDLHFADRLAAL